MNEVSCFSLSEEAMLMRFGDSIQKETHQRLMACKQAMEEAPFSGFIEAVPAYTTLTVFYNPAAIKKTKETIAETLIELLHNYTIAVTPLTEPVVTTAVIELPVCYDLSFGIDLQTLSSTLDQSIQEIIRLHTSTVYQVYMMGFTPGFPYMGIIPSELITQRKQQPRLQVDAGSVALAGNQTGIYPLASPGGWNIIGRTPVRLVNREKKNPFLLKAGDRVHFYSITIKEFEEWSQ